MSEGALSPLLIHLLPLVNVTNGDLGPRHLRSASTPSHPPAHPHREEDLSFRALAVHLFLFGKRLPVLARERLNEPEPKVNLLS